MQKPIMVIRQELINKLTEDINNSGLAPVIVQPILQSLLDEVNAAMRQQYQTEKQEYENKLEEEKKNEGEKIEG